MNENKKPSITLDEIRAMIRADPQTEIVAKNLQIDLEAYVEQVLFYTLNPQAEIQVKPIPAEEFIKLGMRPPTKAEVDEAVAAELKAMKDGQPLVPLADEVASPASLPQAPRDAFDASDTQKHQKSLPNVDLAPAGTPAIKTEEKQEGMPEIRPWPKKIIG